MKRLFTLLAFLLLTMSVVAQQRMHFLGQPLGCSLATFKQMMVSKGYRYRFESNPRFHFFEGFFGGDDVIICAYLTPKSKIVYEVGVFYNNCSSSTKSQLDIQRDLLIKSFINKYGNYTKQDGVFTHWFFDYGIISIGLNYYREYPLTISYLDYLGNTMNEREKESDY